MTPSTPDIRRAIRELGDYANDVRRASHHTIANAVQRYVVRMDATPLGELMQASLPTVEFDVWYDRARGTIRSMVGSGELNWPTQTAHRLALQAELLRRIASGQIDLIEYTYDFHYIENNFDTNIREFINQDFEPFYRDLRRSLTASLEELERPIVAPALPAEDPQATPQHQFQYISQVRLNELRALRPAAFDLRKLIRFCEEIDSSFMGQNFLAMAALTRAVLDHIPPIFGVASFNEVANNYGAGTRSFRESMQHLQGSARRIGDAHLHVQIRNAETLPTSTQVDFSNDLDVLLAEIVRVLR